MDVVLAVYADRCHVGSVSFDPGEERFTFQYTEEWLGLRQAFPLSPHFPLRAGVHAGSSTTRRFLENLMPEGRALDVAASTFHVAKNNLYGLLRQIGRETTGAFSFWTNMPDEIVEEPLRAIPPGELAERIRQRDQMPFEVWEGKVRLSIAGYQDKLPVHIADDQFYLSTDTHASTHILKPEPQKQQFSSMVANEHFCMTLGESLGLHVAPVEIVRLPEPVLVVERFDRIRNDDGTVSKRHVIDACQALDKPATYKYERNFGHGKDVRHIREGVSFGALFGLMEHVSLKAIAMQQLMRWAIFNYLIGNADAHGKNVSFFCQSEGMTVAPFYDLVCVGMYDQVEQAMAMAIGDEFEAEALRPFDWADFAQRTGLKRTLLVREINRMALLAPLRAKDMAAWDTYHGDERALVNDIAAIVERRATRLLGMLDDIRKLPAKWLA